MPPALPYLRALVAAYLDRNPSERAMLAGLSAALDTGDAPTDRSALPGPITCSAVVIDRHRQVLHIRHKASGGLLLCRGGHVEATDDTLPAAALREAAEETGIPAASLVPTAEFRDGPIDIDVHDIAPDLAKDEPGHRHYDFRFVFHLADEAPAPTLQPEEVADAVWLPFDEVSSPTLRAKLTASGLESVIVPVNASAIIHDGRGRYLLHLRDADKPRIWEPGRWSLLGGGREPQDRTHPAVVDEPAGNEAGSSPPSGTVLHVVGVHLYLEHDGRVLLGRRHPNSAYAGGFWHVLAGHCEAEAAIACLVREAYEEAGLVIDPADVDLVHTVHMREQPSDPPRVQLFFRARPWEGTPTLREPDKCVDWQWWNVKDLPEPTVPYTRAAIDGIQAGRAYTEIGWVP
ncbi:NUDIX domain-containing protein [Streptomyces sp. NPDC015130]|uniref:NUDIX hydrolase n=1 Tax=Streptomyces sp. NPDC015130 TaxID=3364940 RepID=UPI0036F5D4CE